MVEMEGLGEVRQRNLSTLYFRTYRAALKGDLLSANFLLHQAMLFLDEHKLPPKGLTRFLVRYMNNPKDLYQALKQKPSKKRGRPPLGEVFSVESVGFRLPGSKKIMPQSEKNALMIAYLLSEGYLINEAVSSEKPSAIEFLTGITSRSGRSLQNDYYKYKDKIDSRNNNALRLGKDFLKFAIMKRDALDRIKKSNR